MDQVVEAPDNLFHRRVFVGTVRVYKVGIGVKLVSDAEDAPWALGRGHIQTISTKSICKRASDFRIPAKTCLRESPTSEHQTPSSAPAFESIAELKGLPLMPFEPSSCSPQYNLVDMTRSSRSQPNSLMASPKSFSARPPAYPSA